MAKAQRVSYFKLTLEDRPGALHAIVQGLKSKNLGLVGLSGQGAQGGQAWVHLIAKNPVKLRNWLKSSGVSHEEGAAFFVRGTDRTGALVKSLGAIAQAGVNIVAIDAIAVGGHYGSFLQVAPGDVDTAAKVLGAA